MFLSLRPLVAVGWSNLHQLAPLEHSSNSTFVDDECSKCVGCSDDDNEEDDAVGEEDTLGYADCW